MHSWQVQETKARMSELIKRAQEQPQDITLHGKSIAVVISRATFDRLSGAGGSLTELMRHSPLYGADDIEIKRDKSPAREVSF